MHTLKFAHAYFVSYYHHCELFVSLRQEKYNLFQMFILIFLAIKFQFIIYIGTDKNKLLLLMIVEHILIITNNYSITHSCIQGGFITMQRKELLNT